MKKNLTTLESPAMYDGDEINRVVIPYRKGGVKAPTLLTGFTLIEIVVVLGILALMMAISTPYILGRIEAGREKATREEMKNIFQSISGNKEKGYLGFLGDMGKLPDTLTNLIVKPTGVSDFNYNHTNKVGMGWGGPYLQGFSEADLTRDEWGNEYQYSPSGANAGQIISGGPDHDLSTTGDNIVFPTLPPQTNGSILVTVLVNTLPQPQSVTVEVYQTQNGAEGSIQTKVTGTNGYGTFDFEVTQGIHAVKVYHNKGLSTEVSRAINLTIPAGQQVNTIIELWTASTVNL